MGAPKLGEEKLIARTEHERLTMAALLHTLYWDEWMSTTALAELFGVETHKSIHGAMRTLGVETRGRSKWGRTKVCVEDGCNLQVHRILHKTNGSWYGRRCRLHWIIFRMMVNQRYADKKLGKDESWLRRMRQLLARVRRLNREVSRSLKPASQLETTSPAA